MEIIKTREGFLVEPLEGVLQTGQPYIFKEPGEKHWWYGEQWRGDAKDAGGRPVMEVLNPSLIRKPVKRL
jgi:hypothetical protein